jgi:hypothetical protein
MSCDGDIGGTGGEIFFFGEGEGGVHIVGAVVGVHDVGAAAKKNVLLLVCGRGQSDCFGGWQG